MSDSSSGGSPGGSQGEAARGAGGAGPAGDKGDAGGRSYLVCPPARPIRLRSDHPVTIGRGEGNSIVLAENFVSRNHAVIEWRDGRFLARDLGSRNGVHVNGERVAEAALEADDEIKIGSRVFTFVVGDEAAVRRLFAHRHAEQRKGQTRALRVAELVEAARGLKGNLADFSLADLLQALHNGGKTGRIAVAAGARSGGEAPPGDDRGEILLQDGEVHSASFGELAGEDAVYRMFEVEDGAFEFESVPVEAEGNVDTSFAALLIEAHRLLDEKHPAPADEAALPSGDFPGEAAKASEVEDTRDVEERDPSAETHVSD